MKESGANSLHYYLPHTSVTVTSPMFTFKFSYYALRVMIYNKFIPQCASASASALVAALLIQKKGR
jgi:hypothetical protein